ncbi:hypothetical protein BGX33_005725, partial [Mortierella sp. NVP41]
MDNDRFGSGVQNYGFHKDGWSANVNWKNEEVGLHGHGTYKFDKAGKNGTPLVWEGCWDTPGDPNRCGHFRAQVKRECDELLK